MTTPDITFDEVYQDEAWRNDVARQLNILLERARCFKESPSDSRDTEAGEAMLSIVERVQEFEEIETVEQLLPYCYSSKKRKDNQAYNPIH